MAAQKILLVQDTGSELTALKKALSDEDIQVTTCKTAFDALSKMRAEPADLLITTISLPDMSGYQLANLIKSGEHTSHVPVIVTGDAKELKDSFWQRASACDLIMQRKQVEKEAATAAAQIKQLLSTARGNKKLVSLAPVLADLNSKNQPDCYKNLVANLLVERSVSHLSRGLVEAVSSRVQFMARLSGYMQRMFSVDVSGLIVVDPKSNWAIYDALVPISKAAMDKLQTQANKAIDLEVEVRTIVNGDLPAKGGAAIKAHEVIAIHDSHNELIGALVLGWTAKPATSPFEQGIVELLKMHMRPVFKALFDLQQIQMLKQHHAFGSYVDPITGLYNIEFLIGFLQQQLLFSSRQKLATGLMLLDVDQFVEINEQFGAETGDMVLMSIGHKLTRNIRQSDLLARYSGDTFAIVLPNTDISGSKVLAEKLRSEIEAMSWDTVGNKPLQVTVCIGCATFNFEDCNPETILRDAKIALMAAKEAGRNRVAPE